METKFVTYWALSNGILQLPTSPKAKYSNCHCVQKPNISWEIDVVTEFIHDTLEQAQAHAEQMRLAEIEKLQSKITKLQELRF
jgi:hypothetical protein